ncbi:hypothetical protein PIB30_109489 [Stylosanthes scabra]|uniref:Uncharacterized protein n=1 Tax=Stylosanthes scabra TaxID=79078 RepID=A0ABU6ZYC8_9FABA|nr:hypothetical protein [Stylosanthes scabra]
MATNRRNARSAPVEANPPLDTPTFVAAMNSMATAMRDSTAAMRESAAATHRAMEQLERQNMKKMVMAGEMNIRIMGLEDKMDQ